jgi:hypothetical protein
MTRRHREAFIRQFQLEQMTSNEWISFERAVSCLTGQKDLATASDARRTLLDAICAGKLHDSNPKALQCLDASSKDDWFWDVSDFRTLVERREGLESVLKNTYFECDSLIQWMRGRGFAPTADIQGETLKTASEVSGDQTTIMEAPAAAIPDRADDVEQPLIKPTISIPKEAPTQAKQNATHRALLMEYPDGEIPWPPTSQEAITKKITRRLIELHRKGTINASCTKTSETTIRRVLKLR